MDETEELKIELAAMYERLDDLLAEISAMEYLITSTQEETE